MSLLEEEKEKKKAQRKRPKQIGFFLSQEETNILEKKIKKSKLAKGEYLRKCALEKEIIVIEDFKECFIELKKQGTNINQIAKALNSGRVLEIKNIEELQREYKKLSDQVNEIAGRI